MQRQRTLLFVCLLNLPGTSSSPHPVCLVLGSTCASGHWYHPFQYRGSYSRPDHSQTPSYTGAFAHLKWSLGTAWRGTLIWSKGRLLKEVILTDNYWGWGKKRRELLLLVSLKVSFKQLANLSWRDSTFCGISIFFWNTINIVNSKQGTFPPLMVWLIRKKGSKASVRLVLNMFFFLFF